MKAFFSYLLIALVLLQTFSREVLMVDFTLNRAALTARYCVNKARPQLHCDGKCYFARQLKKQQERENKAPNPLKERLEMLPTAVGFLVPPGPVAYPLAAPYGRVAAAPMPALRLRAIFRPPQRG